MPSKDQILSALSVDNGPMTLAYKKNASAQHSVAGACGTNNYSLKLSPSMKGCDVRGVKDHGPVPVVYQAPVVAPPVQQDKPCPPNSGQCAIALNYASGSADLTDDARSRLDRLADAVHDLPGSNFRLAVEGHTDTVGSPAANKPLSERRAWTAAQYLAEKSGIKFDRMIVTGVGQDRLVVPTPPHVDEQRNRVVILARIGA